MGPRIKGQIFALVRLLSGRRGRRLTFSRTVEDAADDRVPDQEFVGSLPIASMITESPLPPSRECIATSPTRRRS